jgi:hypothetical protein
MKKLIMGKVTMEDGQMLVRDFEDVKDFVESDYILTRESNLSYEFYYGGQRIERPQPAEGEDEVSFQEEITYLEAMIEMIDNCKMFQ